MSRHFEPSQLAVIWLRIVGAGFAAGGVALGLLGFALFLAGLFLGSAVVAPAGEVRE